MIAKLAQSKVKLLMLNPSTWLAGRTGFLPHPALATPLPGSPLDSRGHPHIPKERSTSSRDWCVSSVERHGSLESAEIDGKSVACRESPWTLRRGDVRP